MRRSHTHFPVLLWLLLTLLGVAAAQDLSADQQRVLTLADSLYEVTAADSAQAILAEAIPQARADNDSLYLQNLIVRQGAQMAAFGKVGPAEPILREALALAEARQDSAVVCQVLRWLGLSLGTLGRWDEAEVTTRRQIALAEQLELPQMTGWAQVALGWYAEQRGQLENAALEYGRGVEIFRICADSTGLAWTLNNLGNARLDLGDKAGAETAYFEAAAIARHIGHVMVEAMAVNNLGVMEFHGGDPGVAVSRFRRAHTLQTELGHAIEKIRTGVNIGLCLVYLNRLEQAADQFAGTLVEAEDLEQPEAIAQVRMALASLRHRQGRPAAAKDLLRLVIYEPRDLSIEGRTEAMKSLAAILADEDSLHVALGLLDEATAMLAGQPNSTQALRVGNVRGELLLRTGRPYEALDDLLEVARRSRETGFSGPWAEALVQAARAYRATDRPDSSLALLIRAAAIWEAERDLPVDPEWREQRGAQGSRIFTDWAAHLLGDPREASPARIQEAFGHLQRFKGRTLLERMQGPGGVSSSEAAVLVSLDRLQRDVLADDELLLDAYLGPETSILIAVNRLEVRAVIWPAAAELERRLSFFHDLHQLPAVGDATEEEFAALRKIGRDLGERLLGNVDDLVVGCRRIIAVPDGMLNLLPWQSLAVESTAGQVELAARQVTVAPSVTIFAEVRVHDDRNIGGPVTIRVFNGGNDLPGARKEAAWLEKAFANVEKTNGAVDLGAWRGFDVLHFAAHARSHDASPWQSEIRIGAASDQAVRAATIAGAELDASLAVLAGCESAGGTILSGEGVQGLTSAFLSAGTDAVLATLWPVDDRATLELVRHFYLGLAELRTAGDALQQAQTAVREDPRTAHPFFWAGFQLVGDGTTTVELVRRRSRDWIWSIPAGFLVLGVILAVRRRLS